MFIRRNKFKAKRTLTDGYSFASQLESALYLLLKSERDIGLFDEIRVQPQVELTQARIIYKPDFGLVKQGSIVFYAEAKGFETDTWRIKRRLWKFYGPAELKVYKGSHKRPYLHETITPKFDELD